jgi:hypothetical protein
MIANQLRSISRYLHDFAWFTGLGISLLFSIIFTLSLISAFSSDNFTRHVISYLLTSALLVCSMNNFFTSKFSRFRSYTLLAEFSIIVFVSAMIALLQSPQLGKRIEYFYSIGDAKSVGLETISLYTNLATTSGWTVVLTSATFYILVSAFGIYYILRIRASRVAA